MLQCSFCNADVETMELVEGRCPHCGGILVWDEARPQPAESLAAGHSLAVAADLLPDGEDESQETTPPGPAGPPPSSPGPPDEREQSIKATVRPRGLSSEETATIQKKWRSTLMPGSSPRMTVKVRGTGPVGDEAVAVPWRTVLEAGGPDDEHSDYKLIDVIGEGGVGVVYAARQRAVDRTVAVKMLRPDTAVEFEQRQKFLAEAIVTGDLDHPNIVPIHELGRRSDGSLFYSMKRVSGTPWSDVLSQKAREENIEILLKVGDAVAFAHYRGVIHRDLKPENVMLGEYGEVLVMDWGIAIPTASFHRQDGLMQSGGLGGTPAYMAPELATGPVEAIRETADVYLLGAILYEIVTGLTPHTGADVMDCVEAAARNEIQPTPHTGELVQIAFKAMATEPQERYESVTAFQAAVRDYQSHSESIALSTRAEEDLAVAESSADYRDYARSLFAFEESLALWPGNRRARTGVPAAKLAYANCSFKKGDFDLGVSLLDDNEPSHKDLRARLRAAQQERDARQQRLRRFRRIALLSVVALIGVISVALGLVYSAWGVAEDNRQEAEYQAGVADDRAGQLKEANTSLTNSIEQVKSLARGLRDEKQHVEKQKDRIEKEKNRAEDQKHRAELANWRSDYRSYLARIALIDEKIADNAFDEARRLLQMNRATPYRNWEWNRLWYVCHLAERDVAFGSPVNAVAASPDGKWFAVAGRSGTVQLLQRRKFGNRKIEIRPANPDKPAVNALAWSPDGTLIATAGDDNRIRLYNAGDGKPHQPPVLTGHSGPVTALKFSDRSINPSRRWLVSGSQDGSVIVWDVDSGRTVHAPLKRHSGTVWSVDVDRKQGLIVSAGNDGRIILWKIDEDARRNGDTTWIGKTPKEVALHNGPVYGVAFSGDGRVVSGGEDGLVLLWRPDAVKPIVLKDRIKGIRERSPLLHRLPGHKAAVRSVAFSPDPRGRLILSASDDNTTKVWDAASGRLIQTLRGHGSYVRSCAFVPGTLSKPDDPLDAVVVSGSHDGRARVWRLSHARSRLVLDRSGGNILDVAVDPLGKRVAAGDSTGVVRVWNVQKPGVSRDDGRLNRRPKSRGGAVAGKSRAASRRLEEGHEFLVSTANFFPDGKRFVTGGLDGSVRVWSVRDANQTAVLQTDGNDVIALSPDGRWIAAPGPHNELLVWSSTVVAGRGERGEHVADAAGVGRFDVADRARTDAGSVGHGVIADQGPITLKGHKATIVALAFSPDGAGLISGDSTGRCYVWKFQQQPAKPRPLNNQPRHREHARRVSAVRFLPDGRRVVTASADETISLWDLSGREIRRVPTGSAVIALDLSPDGKLVAFTEASSANGPADRSKRTETLRLLRLDDGSIIDSPLRASTISSIAFSTDGSRLLTVQQVAAKGQNRGVVRQWRVSATGLEPAGEAAPRDALWSAQYRPGTKQVLVVGGRRAELWDSLKGSVDSEFGPHAAVHTVRFSPNGKWLASGDGNGWVKIWDPASNVAVARLSHRHAGPVVAASFTGRGTLVTVGGRSIAFAKLKNGSWSAGPLPLTTSSRASFVDAAFTPDGSHLGIVRADGAVNFLDLDRFQEQQRDRRLESKAEVFSTQTRHGHTAPVRCISLSNDGRWIVTGGDDRTAIIWQRDAVRKSWLPIARLTGHPAPVTSIAISSDMCRVLTGSDDQTAKVWDTTDLAGKLNVPKDLEAVRLRDDANARLDEVAKVLESPGVKGDAALLADLARLNPPPGTTKKPRAAFDKARDAVARLRSDAESPAIDRLREVAGIARAMRHLIVGPDSIAEVLTLSGAGREITAVKFAPQGEFVVTGDRNGRTILWPAKAAGRKQ